MPVHKFRSIDDMNRAMALKTYPRGVFKFRTMEEAQRAREQSERT